MALPVAESPYTSITEDINITSDSWVDGGSVGSDDYFISAVLNFCDATSTIFNTRDAEHLSATGSRGPDEYTKEITAQAGEKGDKNANYEKKDTVPKTSIVILSLNDGKIITSSLDYVMNGNTDGHIDSHVADNHDLESNKVFEEQKLSSQGVMCETVKEAPIGTPKPLLQIRNSLDHAETKLTPPHLATQSLIETSRKVETKPVIKPLTPPACCSLDHPKSHFASPQISSQPLIESRVKPQTKFVLHPQPLPAWTSLDHTMSQMASPQIVILPFMEPLVQQQAQPIMKPQPLRVWSNLNYPMNQTTSPHIAIPPSMEPVYTHKNQHIIKPQPLRYCSDLCYFTESPQIQHLDEYKQHTQPLVKPQCFSDWSILDCTNTKLVSSHIANQPSDEPPLKPQTQPVIKPLYIPFWNNLYPKITRLDCPRAIMQPSSEPPVNTKAQHGYSQKTIEPFIECSVKTQTKPVIKSKLLPSWNNLYCTQTQPAEPKAIQVSMKGPNIKPQPLPASRKLSPSKIQLVPNLMNRPALMEARDKTNNKNLSFPLAQIKLQPFPVLSHPKNFIPSNLDCMTETRQMPLAKASTHFKLNQDTLHQYSYMKLLPHSPNTVRQPLDMIQNKTTPLTGPSVKGQNDEKLTKNKQDTVVTPFKLYAKKNFPLLAKAKPWAKAPDIFCEMSAEWSKVTDEQKKPYYEESIRILKKRGEGMEYHPQLKQKRSSSTSVPPADKPPVNLILPLYQASGSPQIPTPPPSAKWSSCIIAKENINLTQLEPHLTLCEPATQGISPLSWRN